MYTQVTTWTVVLWLLLYFLNFALSHLLKLVLFGQLVWLIIFLNCLITLHIIIIEMKIKFQPNSANLIDFVNLDSFVCHWSQFWKLMSFLAFFLCFHLDLFLFRWLHLITFCCLNIMMKCEMLTRWWENGKNQFIKSLKSIRRH